MEHLAKNYLYLDVDPALVKFLKNDHTLIPLDVEWKSLPADGEIKDKRNYTLISNNASRIRKYLDRPVKKMNLVYVGELDHILPPDGMIPSHLIKVWPSQGSDRVYHYYHVQLLRQLYAMDDALMNAEMLDSLINSLPELIWFKDRDGRHMLVNDKFCSVVGKTKKQIHGRGHYYIWDITPEDYARGEYVCMESEKEVMECGHTKVFPEQVLAPDGMKHFETYKTPIRDIDGTTWGTVGVAHDLADFSNMGIEMTFIMEHMPLPVVITNKERRISFMNSRFRTEFSMEALILKDYDLKEWVTGNFEELRHTRRGSLSKYSRLEIKLRRRTKNGVKYYEMTEQPIKDHFDAVVGYFCVFRDVTGKAEYDRRLREFSYTDMLTQLYNRRYFFDFVKRHLAQKMTIIFFDLDHFKLVNDTYGHQKGDCVLVKFGKLLREVFPNDLAVRFGGDEFGIVLLGDSDKADVEGKLKRLEDRFAELVKTLSLDLSVSYGIVRHDGSNQVSIDDLLNRCDALMYEQKDAHHRHFRQGGGGSAQKPR